MLSTSVPVEDKTKTFFFFFFTLGFEVYRLQRAEEFLYFYEGLCLAHGLGLGAKPAALSLLSHLIRPGPAQRGVGHMGPIWLPL